MPAIEEAPKKPEVVKSAKTNHPRPAIGEDVFFVISEGPNAGQKRVSRVSLVHTKDDVSPDLHAVLDERGYVNLSVNIGAVVDFPALQNFPGIPPGSVFVAAVRYDATGAPGTWHREGDVK